MKCIRSPFKIHSNGTVTAPQNYDDEIQSYDYLPPEDASRWIYIDQLYMVLYMTQNMKDCRRR